MPLQCTADRYSPSGRLAASSIEPYDIGTLLARSSSSGPSAPRERKSLASPVYRALLGDSPLKRRVKLSQNWECEWSSLVAPRNVPPLREPPLWNSGNGRSSLCIVRRIVKKRKASVHGVSEVNNV